jgi:porphobilinogen synthase
MPLNLPIRPRRLRTSASLRALVAETRLAPADFVQPLFVHDGPEPLPIPSMPGIVRHSLGSLAAESRRIEACGIRGVAVFPVIEPSLKDATGSSAGDETGLLPRALRAVKASAPGLALIADVALDPFTSHGHDGLLAPSGEVENDSTVEALCALAVLEARAGADVVAPSDMMDGRVGAIRKALDAAGFHHTAILSYAAKYASAFYGPFRDAVGSSSVGPISKAGYQMNPANAREALREIALDEAEGADIVMVKPAGPCLDIVRMVRDSTTLPVAAYQVSGEYSQIHAAARAGWLEYTRARDESLLAIRRAGADILFSYFATEFCESQCT